VCFAYFYIEPIEGSTEKVSNEKVSPEKISIEKVKKIEF
jgi:hypothetical protein